MNNNQNNTQKAAEAKNTIDKAAPFGWGLYTDGDPTAATFTKEEAIEAAADFLERGDTVNIKPLSTPIDWLNFTATFEGNESTYTNDEIQAVAARIEDLRKKAAAAGEGGQEGYGAYSWDH